MKEKSRSGNGRAQRADGEATRRKLLLAAGKLIAERGFAAVTSKEITDSVGLPAAAINYHFGSREAMYVAVLGEAHQHVIDIDRLTAMTSTLPTPHAKIEAILRGFLEIGLSKSAPWGFKVMIREAMSPTPAFPVMGRQALRPKVKILLDLLGQHLGLSADHPQVERAYMLTILPSLTTMLAPKTMLKTLLPAVAKAPADLVDAYVTYAMAGLGALKEEGE